MNYEESKLFSLLKKQDIDSLFLEATNYLCQTKFLFEEKEQLQQENQQLQERMKYLERSNNRREDTIIEQRQEISDLEDNWDELKEDLIKIRQLTFTKYNKNEWANCLSFNGDILPLIKKMQEIEQGSDSNE